MIDEITYHQYAGWKLEHDDILSFLKEKESAIYLRFSHVIDVLDYLYDRLIDDSSYSSDDDTIFQAGFLYLENQVAEVVKVLKECFNDNLDEFIKQEKVVNLILNAVEFQNELLRLGDYEFSDFKFFLEFEQEVILKLTKKEEIELAMYQRLDQVSSEIFKKLKTPYYSVSQIFLDIADELELI